MKLMELIRLARERAEASPTIDDAHLRSLIAELRACLRKQALDEFRAVVVRSAVGNDNSKRWWEK